jgi:hypothetical protein
MLRDCDTNRQRPQNTWQACTRLSSFRELLADYCRTASPRAGMPLEIDDRALTTAFFSWTRTLEASERYLQRNAPDSYQFLVGALLAELLRANAVRTIPGVESDARDGESPLAEWWPDGYALTNFCVDLVRRVTAQECGQIVSVSERFVDLRRWQSFRENLRQEPFIAIAYFDDFMGVAANWRNPSAMDERAAAR